MGNKEILKNDELITKFIGRQGKVKKDLYTFIGVSDINNGDPWFTLEDAKFHTSWDWLMFAVEKIEELGYFCMINKWTSVYTGSKDKRISITTVEGNTKILNTWKAITIFINWYNKNK